MASHDTPTDAASSSYTRQLTDDLLAWWITHGPEHEYGGVLTCWDNLGESLVSHDKYTWSQGRWVWLAGEIVRAVDAGWFDADRQAWLETAHATATFVQDHAFLGDGSTAFLLDRDGTPKEPTPGGGLHTSIFADLFVALGFAGHARLTGESAWGEQAERILVSAEQRFAAGGVRSDPYPVPDGYGSFAFPMIMIGAGTEVRRATGSQRSAEIVRRAMDDLATRYIDGDDAQEMPVIGSAGTQESLLARHRTPGHTLECLWFLVEAGQVVGEHELTDPHRLAGIAKRSLRIGWDHEYGGMFRYVDRDGGEPTGSGSGSDPYVQLVGETWSTKLWWIHSEATYAVELLAALTGDAELIDWRDRVRDWTLRTFPQGPGQEWVQNRDRSGAPITRTVALPVKDPMHVARAWLKLAALEHQGRIAGQG